MTNSFVYNMEGEKTMANDYHNLTDHFKKKEFACQCRCGTGEISMELVEKLELARIEYGRSMKINSGIRCRVHNRSIGSKDTSSHIKGLAADVACTSMEERHNLLEIFLKHFKRVGIHKVFIHVDVDNQKTNGVFVY
tara:strand:+ start:258 stop:668 length:411 start_codon:yes stop_codon:yes gene_type:complete